MFQSCCFGLLVGLLYESGVTVTRAIVQAGKLLDVSVVDHIICGLSRWVSLKERGLGFS